MECWTLRSCPIPGGLVTSNSFCFVNWKGFCTTRWQILPTITLFKTLNEPFLVLEMHFQCDSQFHQHYIRSWCWGPCTACLSFPQAGSRDCLTCFIPAQVNVAPCSYFLAPMFLLWLLECQCSSWNSFHPPLVKLLIFQVGELKLRG